MLGGEDEEGEQSFPILRQAGDRLVVLGTVFVGEHIDRQLGCRAGRRAVDLTKVGLHVDLDRESDLVQDIGSLVDPTLPIRLRHTPATCWVRPVAGIKLGIGRRLYITGDAEQRAESVERVEAPVEAKREFVEVGL